jgi:hypothetical protein
MMGMSRLIKEEVPVLQFISECQKVDYQGPVPPTNNPNYFMAYSCPNEQVNALIFRDSFFFAVVPHLSRNFKTSLFVWDQMSLSHVLSLFDTYQPDIVIEEWTQGRFSHIYRKPPSTQFAFDLLFSSLNEEILYLNSFEELTKNIELTNASQADDTQNENYTFVAKGKKIPTMTLRLQAPTNKSLLIKVHLTSPSYTNARLKYRYQKSSGFIHSDTLPVIPGENVLYFELSSKPNNSIWKIILTPGLRYGSYTIHSIQVRVLE